MAFFYIETLGSSYYYVTSVDFNSKQIHQDNIFDQQDILQFCWGVSKDYKYAKSPNVCVYCNR